MIRQVNLDTTDFRGLSSDTKPSGVGNGSTFLEMDTGAKYMYDAENDEWHLMPGGGGGGGGDNTEVISARTGADGTKYGSLKGRLDAENEDLNEKIDDEISLVKSQIGHLEEIALKYQSSTLVGTGTFNANRRCRLNDNPIPKNIHLEELWLVSNDNLLSMTVTIELTTKNSDGTYTVYDFATGSVSYSSGITYGDLVRIVDINKTTQKDGTYVFVSYTTTSQYPRIKMASVTGHNQVVCDTTSGTTFTTRNMNGYEICYLIYAGMTSAYVDGLLDSIDVLNNAVGDYTYHEFFNASQASGNWNSYIYKTIPSGTKVRVSLLSNSAGLKYNVRAYDADNNNQLIGVIRDVGGTLEATLTLNAVYIRIQAQFSVAISNATLAVVVTTDTQPGLVSDLFSMRLPRVYHVEKDGSGDYTNLADAIRVATQWFDSIVYVGAGTWDILEELGQDYLDTASSANRGIVLKNRVHVICSSKAYIKCLYSGSDANIINYLSAFNAGPYGFTLENADIEVANVRYCVHDERNAETDHYDNYYINCRMKNTNQTAGSRSQCIGGGLGYDGHIVIDGCTFENPLRENYGIVSYHNAHGAATDSRSLIEVKGCYFYGKNTFRAGYYGNATTITQCLVHGNSMGAEPYMTQEDQSFTNVNMEIVAWNNEIRSV